MLVFLSIFFQAGWEIFSGGPRKRASHKTRIGEGEEYGLSIT